MSAQGEREFRSLQKGFFPSEPDVISTINDPTTLNRKAWFFLNRCQRMTTFRKCNIPSEIEPASDAASLIGSMDNMQILRG